MTKETETPAAAPAPKPIMFKLNGKDYTADEYPKAFAEHVEAQRKKAAAPVPKSP